jgi:hypothetical protein
MDATCPETLAQRNSRLWFGCPACGSGIHLAVVISHTRALLIEGVRLCRGALRVDIGDGRFIEPNPRLFPRVRTDFGERPEVICRACGWGTEADDQWADALVRLGE